MVVRTASESDSPPELVDSSGTASESGSPTELVDSTGSETKSELEDDESKNDPKEDFMKPEKEDKTIDKQQSEQQRKIFSMLVSQDFHDGDAGEHPARGQGVCDETIRNKRRRVQREQCDDNSIAWTEPNELLQLRRRRVLCVCDRMSSQ